MKKAFNQFLLILLIGGFPSVFSQNFVDLIESINVNVEGVILGTMDEEIKLTEEEAKLLIHDEVIKNLKEHRATIIDEIYQDPVFLRNGITQDTSPSRLNRKLKLRYIKSYHYFLSNLYKRMSELSSISANSTSRIVYEFQVNNDKMAAKALNDMYQKISTNELTSVSITKFMRKIIF